MQEMEDETDEDPRFGQSNADELDSDLYDSVGGGYRSRRDRFETRVQRPPLGGRLDKAGPTRRLRDETERGSLAGDVDEMPGGRGVINDPIMKKMWNEAVDLQEIPELTEQGDFLELRHLLGLELVYRSEFTLAMSAGLKRNTGITLDVLSRFNVKGHVDGYEHVAIIYPRYRGPTTRSRLPTGMKVIRKVGAKLEKENYPSGIDDTRSRVVPFTGIFGYHMATASDTRVVLVTNERDALAVYQGTGSGILTLALPQGELLDPNVFPFLEDFESIYLWFPSVQAAYAKDYAAHLVASRCHIISHKSRPVELLRDGRKKEINRAIREEAIPVRYKGAFRSLSDVRVDGGRSELPELLHGRVPTIAKWNRFDVLNKYLGGFRLRELTVLTGGAGFGKTTFLCEYAMDLQTQGVRTLFCGFDLPEEKILKWMFVQYAGPPNVRSLARSRTFHNGVKIPLHEVRNPSTVDAWLDRFERMKNDLIVMDMDEVRGKGVAGIAKAIREQVITAGIQHVVIDNLQFLIGMATLHTGEKLNGFERYNAQDRFIAMMRELATDYETHVTVTVQPRKADTESELEIQHVGGSGRVTQEADNVLVIQRRRDENDRRRMKKFLYIVKNRFGGRRVESDVIEMVFQPSTYTHQLVDLSSPIPSTSKP